MIRFRGKETERFEIALSYSVQLVVAKSISQTTRYAASWSAKSRGDSGSLNEEVTYSTEDYVPAQSDPREPCRRASVGDTSIYYESGRMRRLP